MDFNKKLDKQVSRLKNLKSFSDKTDTEILRSIILKLWDDGDKKKKYINSPLSWLINVFDVDTLEWIKKEYDKTINDFSFNDSSDVQQLLNYFYRLGRNKNLAEKINESGKDKDSILREMADNTEEMLKIGKSLKLNKEQREADKQKKSLEAALMTIYERVENYRKDHRGEFLWRCSKCKEMNLLQDTPAWMFEGDTPFSMEVYNLVVEGVLTVKQMADILQTSLIGVREMAKLRGVWDMKLECQIE